MLVLSIVVYLAALLLLRRLWQPLVERPPAVAVAVAGPDGDGGGAAGAELVATPGDGERGTD